MRLAVSWTFVPGTTSRCPTKAAVNEPAVTWVRGAAASMLSTVPSGPLSAAVNGRAFVMAAATWAAIVWAFSMTTVSTRVVGS